MFRPSGDIDAMLDRGGVLARRGLGALISGVGVCGEFLKQRLDPILFCWELLFGLWRERGDEIWNCQKKLGTINHLGDLLEQRFCCFLGTINQQEVLTRFIYLTKIILTFCSANLIRNSEILRRDDFRVPVSTNLQIFAKITRQG